MTSVVVAGSAEDGPVSQQLRYGRRAGRAKVWQVRTVFTEHAIADLQRLRALIAIHNPSAATRVATELIGEIELLPDFPRTGTGRTNPRS